MAKSKQFLVDLDLNQNELQNFVIQNLPTAPANPVAGQKYFNTTDNLEYTFDGENWVNALSQGNYTFTDGIQLDDETRTVSLKIESGKALSVNASHELTIADASTDAKGVIEIATDAEASTGTSEVLAVNPKQLASAVADKIELTDLSIASGSTDYLEYNNANGQFGAKVDTTPTENSTKLITSGAVYTGLDGKVDKLENAVTPDTYTKVTVNADGLVTAGTTLSASDIPDISATYLTTDLKGANGGLAELGDDGKVPASQLPSFVDDVIDSYIVDGATAFSAGWLSKTADGSAFTPETDKIYVILTEGQYQNKTYRWSGTTYVEIGNFTLATETNPGIIEIATQAEVNTGTDDQRAVTPLKLATALTNEAEASRVLKNKTIDCATSGTGAGNNVITNLPFSALASGAFVDSTAGISAPSSASDSKLPTEKAVADALALKTDKLVANNPAITPVGGLATWTITNTLGNADVCVLVKEVATGDEVVVDISCSASNIVISFNANATVPADTYRAVAIG